MADFGNTGFGVGAGGALPPNVEKAVQQLVDQRMRALLANDVSSLIIPRSLPESAITPAGAAGSMLVDDGRTTKWVAPGANGSVLTRDDTQPGLVAWKPATARFKVGSFTVGGSTGARAISGVGFKPGLVTFETVYTNGAMIFRGVGAMDASGGQWAIAHADFSGSMNEQAVTNAAILLISNAGVDSSRAAFASMDTDGFTVTFSAVDSTTRVFWTAYA